MSDPQTELDTSQTDAGAEPHLIAIGRIATYFGALEANINFFTAMFADSDPEIRLAITSELSFRKSANALLAIYRLREGENSRTSALKSILDRALKLEPERNNIFHSNWVFNETDKTFTRLKSTVKNKAGLQHHFVKYEVHELEEYARKIVEVLTDLVVFFSDHARK